MANNNYYAGLEWALTSQAKEALVKLEKAGVDKDLAYLLLDNQVKQGSIGESEVYQLEDDA